LHRFHIVIVLTVEYIVRLNIVAGLQILGVLEVVVVEVGLMEVVVEALHLQLLEVADLQLL
uniref:Uncharacterized protein n=1 Tax=Amphimedon queenslandica TaxID=400682 RepID=A0A1X7UXC2_AMPQE